MSIHPSPNAGTPASAGCHAGDTISHHAYRLLWRQLRSTSSWPFSCGRAAAQAFSLDRILFAPTGRQPLKTNGASASFADRLAMVSLLCELQPSGTRSCFEPSSGDAPHADGLPNYTVDILFKLRADYPTDESLFVIVGADAFLDLPIAGGPPMSYSNLRNGLL